MIKEHQQKTRKQTKVKEFLRLPAWGILVLAILVAIGAVLALWPLSSATLPGYAVGLLICIGTLYLVGFAIHLSEKNPEGPLVCIDCRTGKTYSMGGRKDFSREQLALLRALHSDDSDKRLDAENEIVKIGTAALPTIYYHCREEGDEYRQSVERVINRIHPDGLLAALTEALEGGEPDMHARWQICNILRDMHEKAAPAIPALIHELRTGPVFTKAYDALISIGVESIPALIEVLEDSSAEESVRCSAVIILMDCVLYNKDSNSCLQQVQQSYREILEDATESEELKTSVKQALETLDEESSQIE